MKSPLEKLNSTKKIRAKGNAKENLTLVDALVETSLLIFF